MARLNDPPQPAGESVDALKRRFVRQNRELARVNSTQSLRIRNLETEVSRLLAENVSLREQVIKSHYELENTPARSAWDKVEGLKKQLESRLNDLGSLLHELGDVKKNATKQQAAGRKSLARAPSPKKSPNQRQWKTNMALADVAGEADGRLPTIVEDKHFPRRTLDGNDVMSILSTNADLTDSPEIGSPPVAHFEAGEAIKFYSNASSEDIQSTELSANHATRKRRRESFHQGEAERQAIATSLDGQRSSRDRNQPPSHALKSEPKRKLNVRDQSHPANDEEVKVEEASTQEVVSTEKIASRAAHELKLSKVDSKPSEDKPPIQITVSGNNKSTRISNPRQPLRPKSTNSDPQSPAKLGKRGFKDKSIGNEKDASTKRTMGIRKLEDKPTARKVHKVTENIETIGKEAVRLDELLPKTPNVDGLDLFSPIISDPSVPRPERGDTPPPPDLGPDTGTGSFGRASRRSKSSISYAEPNLRDKMRRPTKELVDAVAAGERVRQAAMMSKDDAISSLEGRLADLKFKQEDNGEQSGHIWRTKPVQETRSQQQRQEAETTSPLGKKASGDSADLPASVMTDRRRRASAIVPKDADGEPHMHGSGAANAIAALANGAHRKQKTAHEALPVHADDADTETHDAANGTSIFDFTSSSPEYAEKTNKQEGTAKLLRVSRRHSTVPSAGDSRKSSITVTRRRQSTLPGNDQDAEQGERHELKRVKSTITKDPTMRTAEGEPLGRAASRRRSMML